MSPSAKPSEAARPDTPRAQARRPWWRRLLRGALWCVGGLLLLVALLLGFLETGPGRRTLAGLIEDFGSSPEMQIKVTGLEGSLWSELRIAQVTLADQQGTWLTVDQAVLAWQPSALFDKRLVVSALAADKVDLQRLPPSTPTPEEEEPDSDPLALPSLPVEVDLRTLRVGTVVLGQPILGTPAELTLQGTAGLDDSGARVSLDLRRLDGAQGAVSAVLAWRPAQDYLELSLQVAEPQGGLAARLLDLPDLPSVDLDLEGSGPLSAWKGRLDLALNGAPAMTADMTIDGREKRALALDGTIAANPLLPPEALGWVGEGLTLAARLTLGEDQVVVERLDLASSAVAVSLAGTVGLESEAVDLTGHVSLRDGQPLRDLVPDVTLTAAELDLTAKGTFEAPAVTLTADLAGPGMTGVAMLSRAQLHLTSEGPLDAPSVTLTADLTGAELPDLGTLSRAQLRLTSEGPLDAPDVTLAADLTGADAPGLATLAQARLDLTSKGPLTAPAVTLAARLTAPAMPGLVTLSGATLNLTADPQGPDALGADGFAVTLDAALDDPQPQDPSLPPYIWGDLTLKAAGAVNAASGSVLLRHLDLQGDQLALTADGSFAYPEGAADLELALRAALPPLPETDNQPLELALQGHVSGADVMTAPAGSLTLDVTGADKLSGGVGPLLGAAPRLAGAFALGEDGTITLTDITLTAARADLAVDGTYGPAGVALTWKVALPDLAAALEPFGQAASGSLDLAGRLEGPSSEDFDVTATIVGRGLAAEGQTLGDLDGSVDLQGLPNQPRGSIALKAPNTSYGPVDLAATVAPRDDGGFDVAPLTVALGEALKLDGHLQASAAGLPLIGEIKGTVNGGPLWAKSFGLPLAGRGTLAVTLTAPDGRQDAAVTLALGPGQVADIAHGGVKLDAKAADLLGTPALDARATVTALRVDPARLDSVVVTAKGPLTGMALTLETRGAVEGLPNGDQPGDGAVTLSLAAKLEQAGETLTVALSRLQGEAGGFPIALDKPTKLTVTGDTLALAPTALTVADASITLEARNGADPKLAAKIEGLDLARFDALFGDGDTTVKGIVNLTLALAGGGDRPSGTLTLDARGLAVQQAGLSQGPAIDVVANGKLARGRFDLDSTVSGDFGRDLTLSASLPLLVSLQSFQASVPDRGEIAGRADWNGEIAALIDFLPLDNQILTGQATLDVTLSGTMAAPQVSGGFKLDKGRYENLLTATVLADLTLDIAGEGQRVTIRKASATDGGKGRLSLDGWVDLAASGFAGDVKLKVRDFALLRRDDLDATLDADLALAERAEGLALTGTVTTDQVDIDINANLPASVTPLEVTFVRDGVPINPPKSPAEQEAEARQAEAAVPFTLLLDMTVDLPRRVYVSGNGLESEWSGKLTITGTADKPLILGTLTPIRGQFDLVGKTFLLSDSTVTFDGSAEIDPALNINAVTTTSDLTATIHIGGRASKPALSITSSPELPQEEILSRVLFDRGSGRLSAVEALQLAEAAAIFSGATGSDKTVVQRLRDTFGLDVLRIEGGENGEAVQATLGQYVAPNVFVGVTQGSAPGSTAAKVEVDITDNIKLEGTAGSDADTSVGIRWQWDY